MQHAKPTKMMNTQCQSGAVCHIGCRAFQKDTLYLDFEIQIVLLSIDEVLTCDFRNSPMLQTPLRRPLSCLGPLVRRHSLKRHFTCAAKQLPTTSHPANETNWKLFGIGLAAERQLVCPTSSIKHINSLRLFPSTWIKELIRLAAMALETPGPV